MRFSETSFSRRYSLPLGLPPVAKGGGIEPPTLLRRTCALDIYKCRLLALPEGRAIYYLYLSSVSVSTAKSVSTAWHTLAAS